MAYGTGAPDIYGDTPNYGGGGGGGDLAGAGLGALLGGPFGAALMALLPSLMGGFFRNRDPNRMNRQRVEQIMDPWNIRKQGQDEYTSILHSPGYSQARSETIGGGQNAINQMNTTIGQRGLGRSGVGLAMPAAVTAGVGANLGRLSAGAWDQAQQNARQMAYAKASTIAGMPVEPNYGANLFAGGLNALLPLLMKQFGGGNKSEEELLAILRRLLG